MPLRYCAVRFACKVPTLRLPAAGNVAGLVTEGGEEVAPSAHASSSLGALGGHVGGRGSSGRGYNRVRLSRKTPAREVFSGSSGRSPSSSCLEEVIVSVSSLGSDDDAGGRQLHDHLAFGAPVQDRVGIG